MLDKAAFFVEVVRTGSISEGARIHGISTSAGSRWIKELEEELGVSLLMRSTRTISPTDVGKLLYQQYDPIYRSAKDVFTGIQNLEHEMRGLIKIAATPLFAQKFLSQIVGEYLAMHPKVSFKILETALPVDHLHEVDFSIKAHATYKGHLDKDSLLVKRVLLRYPLVACCSPDYIQQNEEPMTPEELKYHNCLYTSTLVGGNRWQFEKQGVFTTVEIAQTIEIENSMFVKNVALQGGGVAYLPKQLVKEELQSGTLVSILNDYVKSEFELSLYYQKRTQMPARCTDFKDYLISRTKELKDEM
ncbi:LysR family transcriptional regulator [Vibrio sp. S4M6]|uniref:LysR family transcriptional regulator n=1 Tax=Vibrio sinus TaxID=2946865 RepID=UPI00202A3D02|nr:LysR family transcriptional regulator [Vibrio sinus]MCL9781648.1 LysR family transcriptional regulator [Vibrio sinus]